LPGQAGWQIRVVPNKFPALTASGARPPAAPSALCAAAGFGVHDVVIESPEHVISPTALPAPAVTLAFQAYAQRLRELRARGDLAYGIVFKNVGAASGASLEHVHSQILSTALLPPAINRRLECWRQTFQNGSGRTVLEEFCRQELDAGLRVVRCTENFVAICPFASRFPLETRVVPLSAQPYFEETPAAQVAELAELVRDILHRIESEMAQPAYNLIIHTAPFDTLPHDYYHWHIEILPRMARAAGFEWGTGCFINAYLPEDVADRLRR
jgi:UDPglucose--hexose-1-phosphate uridylyltransferase